MQLLHRPGSQYNYLNSIQILFNLIILMMHLIYVLHSNCPNQWKNLEVQIQFFPKEIGVLFSEKEVKGTEWTRLITTDIGVFSPFIDL